MSSANSPTFLSLHLRQNSISNPSVTLPTSQLILQPFRCFIYVTVHFPTLHELCSFSKLSVTSRKSQLILILQAFRHFTYVTAHSPTLPSLYLRDNSFSNPSAALPTSQLILEPFHWFTYVIMHQSIFRFSYVGSAQSPTFPSLHLRHCSFSNPSVALPMSQLILQPIRRFTYVTAHSPTLPSLYLRHSSFSNPSVASPTSQSIFQPFFRFSYVTSS